MPLRRSVAMRWRTVATTLACAGLAACGGGSAADGPAQPPTPPTVERVFDFALGDGGWLAGQADYGPTTAPTDVVAGQRNLPSPFTGTGYYIAGTNRSDDLLLYTYTRITGLQANQLYRLSASVSVLTDVPAGCVGVGGSPGESVWVLVAAAPLEPQAIFNGTDYRLNLERGNQSQGGPQGVVLGNVATSVPDCGPRRWESKTLATPAAGPLELRATERGELWLLLGLDSGYESFSQIYWQRVTLSLVPAG